jgi:hypothetical protein
MKGEEERWKVEFLLDSFWLWPFENLPKPVLGSAII